MDQQPTVTKKIFSEAETANFSAFLHTLQRIHTRLMVEGYVIRDGKLVPPMRTKKYKHGNIGL